MRWNDAAYLISENFEADKIGNQIPKESRRRVFVNRFTLSASSYSAASVKGIMPSCELQMRSSEYHGEELLEFHGEQMSIAEIGRAHV